MAKKSQNGDGQYVRKETFWLVTLLALAVGFFAGVMFAIFKSDNAAVPGQRQVQMPQAQAPQSPAADPGLPGMRYIHENGISGRERFWRYHQKSVS